MPAVEAWVPGCVLNLIPLPGGECSAVLAGFITSCVYLWFRETREREREKRERERDRIYVGTRVNLHCRFTTASPLSIHLNIKKGLSDFSSSMHGTSGFVRGYVVLLVVRSTAASVHSVWCEWFID